MLIASVMRLPGRYLATKGRMRFAEPLLSNHKRDRGTDTQTDRKDS